MAESKQKGAFTTQRARGFVTTQRTTGKQDGGTNELVDGTRLCFSHYMGPGAAW